VKSYLRLFFILALVATFGSGCSTLKGLHSGIFGKKSKQTAVVASKISVLEKQQDEINDKKLTTIGSLSTGVTYALNQDTNSSAPVAAAQEINVRIASLANKPDLKEVKVIQEIVNNLITNKANGEKLLAAKDKEIIKLNQELSNTIKEKDEKITQAMQIGTQSAITADSVSKTLDELGGNFGLNSVAWGLKRFFSRMLYLIIALVVIFIGLKIASAFNPVAASIFSICETMLSWIISTVKSVAPKAVNIAGFTSTKTFEDYKSILTKLIHVIQQQKTIEKSGTDVTLDNLMSEIDKNMNDDDRQKIEAIKKDLNWA